MIPSGANLLLPLRFSLKTSFGIEVRYHTRSTSRQQLCRLPLRILCASAVIYAREASSPQRRRGRGDTQSERQSLLPFSFWLGISCNVPLKTRPSSQTMSQTQQAVAPLSGSPLTTL